MASTRAAASSCENAGTLRELTLVPDADLLCPVVDTVAELLRAAPGLHLFETGVRLENADSLPLLRKQPPFGPPLRLIRADISYLAAHDWQNVADGLPMHTTIESVVFTEWPEVPVQSDALVAALLSLPQLRSVSIFSAYAQGHVSVLAHLAGHPALRSLCRWGDGGQPLFDSAASADLFCNTLRANPHIEMLTFNNIGLWYNMAAGTALMTTLQTLPSLKKLQLSYNGVQPEHAAAAGTLVGALILNAPGLKSLVISFTYVGNADLGPIYDALPHARQLETLDCLGSVSNAFARDRILPAVRACAPLRHLSMGAYQPSDPSILAAMRMLEKRRRLDPRH